MTKIKNTVDAVVKATSPHLGYYFEIIIAFVLFAQGVLSVWPDYDLPSDPLGLSKTMFAQDLVGVSLITASVLLFWGLSQHHFPTRRVFRRAGSFLAFITMSFLTFLGVLSEEVNDVYWLATGGLAIMAAVMYVKIGRRD